MAALNDLIAQIADPDLRDRIQQEVNKLNKQKKFGLVWENHEQENALLQGVPIKAGKVVAVKGEAVNDTYQVQSIADGQASCLRHKDQTTVTIPMNQLVCVARVGDSIYPYLEPLDSICNAPDSSLWHTLIEADNYHALQLLEYLYAGKVDCIYIDPPYNTGAKDWKYNNDYVDVNDSYRHSRWLSMMEKRLRIAKKILNPADSILIITIDEKEYHHLACLLEELFPDSRMQMVSSVINPKGNRRDNEFSRCEEYLFFVYIGAASLVSNGTDMLRETETDINVEDKSVRLRALLRQASNHGKRSDRPNLFYPLLFDKNTGHFVGHGPVLKPDENRDTYEPPQGIVAMWPLGVNGTELTWNLQPSTLMEKYNNHFLSFGKFDGEKRTGYYLSEGQEENFKNGLYRILGQDDDGAYIIELKTTSEKDVRPLTIWHKKSHSASEYGTSLLNSIFRDRRFSFPKSLYAVEDAIRFFVADKPNALIIDFFAGSGTTLHAVNLLNSEDGGNRQCIMVTNNEVSVDEAKQLTSQGYQTGDQEWERFGIAKYVTWPRTVCSIEGHDVNENPLKGNYIGSDRPMSEGFKANAAFFKLGFLDKNAVSLGRKFKELLPVMWMQTGAHGPCPSFNGILPPPYLIFAENRFAILNDENCFAAFAQALEQISEIETVFLMTESESGYQEMLNALPGKVTHQLYREYTDHFRINVGR